MTVVVKVNKKKSPAKKKTQVKKSPQKGRTIQKKSSTAKKKTPSDPVEAWVDKMNKSSSMRGVAQIRMAADLKTTFGLRRPTGLLNLDIALGGGLHAGGVIQVQGSQSVGKTNFVWHACGVLQSLLKENTKILIASTELRPDKGQARQAGFCIGYSEDEINEFDELRVLHGQPRFTQEERDDLRLQIGKVANVMANTAEKLFDVILDATQSDIFQLIVIDSLGALLPKAKEEATSLTEKSYGGASVPVTDFVNNLYRHMIMEKPDGSLNETTILAINQARARIGGSRFERDAKEAMGAYAWKHMQFVDILLERGAKVRETKEGPVLGHVVRWVTLKGKMGTHDGIKGEYSYWHIPRRNPVFWNDVQQNWYGGIALYNEHAETAVEMGLIKASGAWYSYTRENGEEVRAQGKNALAQELANDPELLAEIREACFRKAGVFVRHK